MIGLSLSSLVALASLSSAQEKLAIHAVGAQRGTASTITVSGSSPGALVFFWGGALARGAGVAPRHLLQLADPRLLDVAVTGARGEASLVVQLRPGFEEGSLFLQAATLKSSPARTVSVTNVVGLSAGAGMPLPDGLNSILEVEGVQRWWKLIECHPAVGRMRNLVTDSLPEPRPVAIVAIRLRPSPSERDDRTSGPSVGPRHRATCPLSF